MNNKQIAPMNAAQFSPGTALISPVNGFNTHGEVFTSLAANGGRFDKAANMALLLEELTHWAIFASALVLEAVLVDILWLG